MILEPVSELGHFMPMVESWLAYNAATSDAMMDGKHFDLRDALLSDGYGIEYFVIIDSGDAGIVAHRENGDYMDGVMLWIEPERRGTVSLQSVFDCLLEIAANRKKKGIRFESKLWGNAPAMLGFELTETKQDGADTVSVWTRNIKQENRLWHG